MELFLKVNDRLLNCLYTHNRLGDLNSLTRDAVCMEISTPIRSLNRAISELRQAGYMDYQSKHFVILSQEKLEKHCGYLLG